VIIPLDAMMAVGNIGV